MMAYIPNQGDIIYLDFDLQAGHEQIPSDLMHEVFDIIYSVIEIE